MREEIFRVKKLHGINAGLSIIFRRGMFIARLISTIRNEGQKEGINLIARKMQKY